MSLISPLVIEGPLERKGVRTPEAYRAFQQRIISSNRLARPDLEWQGPWRATDQPPVYIGAGTWLVRCGCGDCATVSPEWRLACCCYCGAIYDDLTIPVDRAAITAVLLCRPRRVDRNWRPPTTVAELRAENLAHSDPVP